MTVKFRKILNIFCFGEEIEKSSESVASEKGSKKGMIRRFVFERSALDGHTPLYRLLVFLLIFTSGMGSVCSFMGIRPSYVAAFAVAVMLGIDKLRTLDFTANRRYLFALAFLFVWGAYALLQALFVRDVSFYAIYLKGLFINIFLIFVIIDYVRDANDVRFLLYCFATYIAVCLAIGLFEIFTNVHIVRIRETSNWLPHSFYGNQNDNAAVLAYGVFVILLCLLRSDSYGVRSVFSVLLAVAIFEVIATESRAAILGLCVMAVFTALLAFLVYVRERSRKTYRILLISGFSLFLLALCSVFIVFTPAELIELLSGEGNQASDSLRLNLIISGIRSLFETYGLGLGAGQSITLNGINLHNFYLEILSEYGAIIGGTFVAGMIAIMFEFTEFKWSCDKERNLVADGLLRSFPIALVLIGIGPSSAVNIRSTWVIISIAFALKYVSGNTQRTAEIK